MRIGSLFSGYGGLDIGVQSVLGGDLAWVSDIEPAACTVLAAHHPDVPNLGDITAVDWENVPPVDILTGGFPCQDVSAAGKRLGLRPDTRTGLWNHMAYAINILRPRLVIAENVRGLLSAEAHSDMEPCPWCLGEDGGEPPLRALGAVLADLASLGYDARWGLVRASDAGAPHGRARLFIAAHPHGEGLEGHVDRPSEASTWRRGHPVTGAHDPSADTVSERHDGSGDEDGEGETLSRWADAARSADVAWGKYRAAIRRWEGILGRPAPAPTVLGRSGPRLNPVFSEWLMGLDEGHVTGHGLSIAQELKLIGNGVVPRQAAMALTLLGVAP